jgi:hypothetical protein
MKVRAFPNVAQPPSAVVDALPPRESICITELAPDGN